MQSSSLKSCKIGFNQIEPRGIGGRPINMDTSTDSCGEFSQRLFVSAEVIHDQVDSALGPGWQHLLQPESPTTFSRFCGKSLTDRPSTMGVKGTKPLQSPIAFVTVRTQSCVPAPCVPSPGDCLQWAHFVKADNLAPSGTMAVDLNYSVFFTSNSGSVLLHQVCPVRNRRPWRDRTWRIVSRLSVEMPQC
jgi:hypothetical protein